MDCANCGFKGANIKLSYLGKTVCNDCFCKIIERRISKTIKNHDLLKKGDKIAVAISGGKDSALILEYLADYAKHGGLEIFAVYVNRGDKYSISGLKMVKKQIDKLNVALYELNLEKELGIDFNDMIYIKNVTSLSLCSVCAVFRRHLINKKAKEMDANKVATGHNLTDEAQSYLMNMIRGDVNGFAPLGPKSLPIRKGLVQRIRILRQIPENEVKRYVEIKGISYLPNQCSHRKGSLRFNTLDILEDIKKFRPGAEFSICKVGDFIAKKVRSEKSKLKNCKNCGEPASSDLCRTCQYLELLKNKK